MSDVCCLTVSEAKSLVRGWLMDEQLPYTRLTGRLVNFRDLARASCIFVKIHGWQPDPRLENIEKKAKAHGFRVETDWCID